MVLKLDLRNQDKIKEKMFEYRKETLLALLQRKENVILIDHDYKTLSGLNFHDCLVDVIQKFRNQNSNSYTVETAQKEIISKFLVKNDLIVENRILEILNSTDLLKLCKPNKTSLSKEKGEKKLK